MKVIKYTTSRYDEETETWKLTSLDESVGGTSPASIASMGTGLQSWQFDKYLIFVYEVVAGSIMPSPIQGHLWNRLFDPDGGGDDSLQP